MTDNKKDRPQAKRPKNKSSTEKIFGSGVYKHGFTGVPNIMVRAQARLGLNPVQFNILVQLLGYYMDPNRPPFPSKRDLLARMNISESTLKKHIKRLESKGFIKREQRTTPAGDFGSNTYHLDGLVEKLKRLVPHFDKERKEREERRRGTEKPNPHPRAIQTPKPKV